MAYGAKLHHDPVPTERTGTFRACVFAFRSNRYNISSSFFVYFSLAGRKSSIRGNHQVNVGEEDFSVWVGRKRKGTMTSWLKKLRGHTAYPLFPCD